MTLWIPTSERVPETEDHVLCTTQTKRGTKNVLIGYYIPAAERWAVGMNSNVIAWAPLPRPYDGGEQ